MGCNSEPVFSDGVSKVSVIMLLLGIVLHWSLICAQACIKAVSHEDLIYVLFRICRSCKWNLSICATCVDILAQGGVVSSGKIVFQSFG